MKNKELSRIFNEIADLMEIGGQDAFRVITYRRVARTMKELIEDVEKVADDGRLTDIRGIGKGTAERIQQFLDSGEIAVHRELKEAIPAGLPGLLDIAGLGPKKVKLLWEKLGVESLTDLERELDSGAVEGLPGMGAKSAKQISQGIEFLKRSRGRTPLGVALPVARELAERIGKLPGVTRVSVAGSLRRGAETIGDADILAASSQGKEVIDAFLGFAEVRQKLAGGATKGSALVEGDLQVDLRVVEDESFGAALQYFTGSKEHNVRLREIAIGKGWKLNEYGLFDGEKQIAGKREEQVYKKLGLPFVPPELREDRGEIEADEIPELIAPDDIRGDLHVHTTASDGHNTLDEMIEAARRRGWQYLGISDHSGSSVIANGLGAKRMAKQIEDVRAAAKATGDFGVLLGAEVDILAEGRLDYPDDLLAELDLVIASIHSGLTQNRRTVTKRTIRAMENPYVHAIGHPTGRLIGRREAMDLDIDAVVKAAVATNTALEINAAWQRLDLRDIHVRQAVEAGAKIIINTDAHATDQLDFMSYGITTARRGWASKHHVVNTMTLAQLRKWLARR